MSFNRVWHQCYPPGVPSIVDIEPITMPEALLRSVRDFPERIAFIYMGKKITYAELNRMVNRFANALVDLGVQRGDRVGMLLPNIPQVIIADYAVYAIGAVTVMNNPLYTERELVTSCPVFRPFTLDCSTTNPSEKWTSALSKAISAGRRHCPKIP
jgi:long-chain acyl-CoA synthetase